MGKCPRCGKSVGFLSSSLCEDCKAEARAEEERLKAEKAESAKRALEEIEILRANVISLTKERLEQSVASGKRAYLYESVYIPVDSVVTDSPIASSFSIGALRNLGVDGWEIVGVVPRTIGVGLVNSSFGDTSGDTWGAGVGGNIAGVYVILKMDALAQKMIPESIEEYVRRNADDFMTS